jgi:integrase
VLWVYQTKLIALPPIDRWKPVPLIYDEQKFAAKIIEDGLFERPLNKTVRRYFGEGVTLYGGRKGFTDLMLGKGHTLEAISQWMGHSTIGRTWRTYKDRLGVEFSMPNKVG